jgi:hypothetical protein
MADLYSIRLARKPCCVAQERAGRHKANQGWLFEQHGQREVGWRAVKVAERFESERPPHARVPRHLHFG